MTGDTIIKLTRLRSNAVHLFVEQRSSKRCGGSTSSKRRSTGEQGVSLLGDALSRWQGVEGGRHRRRRCKGGCS